MSIRMRRRGRRDGLLCVPSLAVLGIICMMAGFAPNANPGIWEGIPPKPNPNLELHRYGDYAACAAAFSRGETLSVQCTGLVPQTLYRVRLLDPQSAEVNACFLFTDIEGRLRWNHSFEADDPLGKWTLLLEDSAFGETIDSIAFELRKAAAGVDSKAPKGDCNLTYPPPEEWTTIITDTAGDGGLNPCLDILSLGYVQDGTYSYFSMTVKCDYVSHANTRFSIFLDTDGDGNNDYLIWMENPSKVDLYEWADTGCFCSGGDCWEDTNSTTTDFCDPDLTPDNTLYMGVATAEIGGQGSLGGASATSSVQVNECCHDPSCMGGSDSTGGGTMGVANVALSPAPVCAGTSAMATATAMDTRAVYVTFNWIDPGDTTRFTESDLVLVPSGGSGTVSSSYAPPDLDGDWYVRTDYFDASFGPLPDGTDPQIDETHFDVCEYTAEAGDNITICTGDAAVIGGSPTASGGTGPYTYSWSPSTGLDDDTAANPSASPAVTTAYTVTVTDVNGCPSDQDQVTVTVESCINLLRNADVTQLCPQDPPSCDIFSGTKPSLNPSGDLEKNNYTSGGTFDKEYTDLLPGSCPLIFYELSGSAGNGLRVTIDVDKIVITY